MTTEQIIKTIEEYEQSPEYKRLVDLQELYEGDNPDIIRQGMSKKARNKTPNNIIPTAYYSTVVDSMAGYMFQDIMYVAENEEKQEQLNQLLEANNIQVEDMTMGVSALAYDKGVEYVYTDMDAVLKVNKLNPANTIIVYSDDIDTKPMAAINFKRLGTYEDKLKNIHHDYKVLYVEPTIEVKFATHSGVVSESESRPLFFKDLPVVSYKAQIIGDKTAFQVCVPYIEALDALVSGNSNEIERLVDAILVLGRRVDDEDLKRMDEWKILEDMGKEDRAEFLTKDTSPEFRRYVSDLLIREIHKHSHVVDWYSPDQGANGEASGKALKMRLFDMDMYSNRIEMAYREGMQARLVAMERILEIQKKPIGPVKVIFKRTTIDDFIDDAVALATVPFLTDVTKREYLGVDEAKEQERIEAQGVELVEDEDNRIDG